MAATVHVDEGNGAVETTTEAIGNTHYGSTDTPNLDDAQPSQFITAGTNSFEKWQRLHVTAMGGSAAVLGVRFFTTGSPAGNTEHRFNGHTVQATYATLRQTIYAQPATTILRATQVVPTSDPAIPNIGISGDLALSLSAPGRTDYIVSQIRALLAATSGTDLPVAYGWDEGA